MAAFCKYTGINKKNLVRDVTGSFSSCPGQNVFIDSIFRRTAAARRDVMIIYLFTLDTHACKSGQKLVRNGTESTTDYNDDGRFGKGNNDNNNE